MNRIDALIQNPGVYYDDKAIDGFIAYCEKELVLTNGDDLHLLDSFKLWAEQILDGITLLRGVCTSRQKMGTEGIMRENELRNGS